MESVEWRQVLEFWFGDDVEGWAVPAKKASLWFTKDPATDDVIREQFSVRVERALRGELDAWLASANGTLACIILLDQFTRNLYRDDARAFSGDERALQMSKKLVEMNADHELLPIYRVFAYLPFEHSEAKADQEESMRLYRALADEAPEAWKPKYEEFHDYAMRHKVIIDQFGRYPHRNQILGRESTESEIEFLRQPGSSF